MTTTARQLAIVRRAAFGALTDGEPVYDPPIQAIEVAEMREWLSFSHALHEPISDHGPGSFRAALEAALKRIAHLRSPARHHVRRGSGALASP